MAFQENDNHVIHSIYREAVLPQESLGKTIMNCLLQAPEGSIATVDAFTEEKLSHSKFLQKIVDLATSLRILGYQDQNAALSICSENCLDYFVPQFAAILNLSIPAPINHNYTAYELEHVLKITTPKMVFCSRSTLNKIVEMRKKLKFIERIIILENPSEVDLPEGVYFLDQFTQTTLKNQHVDPKTFKPYEGIPEKTVGLVLCSSGTTGLPKGVALSHLGMLATTVQFAYKPLGSGEEEKVHLGWAPLFHVLGNMLVFNYLLNTQTVICFKRFDEDVFLKTIQAYKIKTLVVVPPVALFLAKSPKVDRYDLSSVKCIVSGGAPLSKLIEEEVKTSKHLQRYLHLPSTQYLKEICYPRGVFNLYFPCGEHLQKVLHDPITPNPLGFFFSGYLQDRLKCKEVRQAFGMTEMTFAIAGIPPGVERPGSCGILLPFLSSKVIDPDSGKSLPPKQVGEVCFKGPSTMMGYYNNSLATKQALTSNGWFRTGDLGYYDEEEYLYVVDRLKELIKYKSFQVAPAELEGVLINHPEIADAGVVGLPERDAGELPLAFVVKKSGSRVTEVEIKNYVSGVLCHQKHLRGGVIFVDSIPKNPSGKILRKELRRLLQQYLKSKL